MKRFELVTKKVFRGDLEEEFVIPGKKNFPFLARWTLSHSSTARDRI